MRILVSGASGLIGSRLTIFLCAAGHEVVHLVRKKEVASNEIFWDPSTETASKEKFEGFDLVIHLAGKNIAERRWTDQIKKELFLSRCRDTWLLSHILTRLERPPKCLITASAIGIYGNRGEEILTEESPPGVGFLAELCEKWEEATQAIEQKGTRVVHTRFGIVLSKEGGVLAKLLPSFRLGLGAILGSGKQFLSWVTLDDLVYAIYHAAMHEELKGAINVVSPHPATQEEFSRALAKALHRPCFLRLPASLLRLLFGEMADEMLLSSTRAVPKKLLISNFRFTSPVLEEALTRLFLEHLL